MNDLRERVLEYNREIRDALQLIVDTLNKGQRQKIMKNPAVAELLKRYRVETEHD